MYDGVFFNNLRLEAVNVFRKKGSVIGLWRILNTPLQRAISLDLQILYDTYFINYEKFAVAQLIIQQLQDVLKKTQDSNSHKNNNV